MINGKISKLIFLKPQNIIFTYIQRLTLPTPGEISKKGIQPFFSIMAFSCLLRTKTNVYLTFVYIRVSPDQLTMMPVVCLQYAVDMRLATTP